ncbi:hypothetical protein [Streptomyces salyersiae]|uniref:Uncharacterized protein n=1 Tax=Streptomyces salyersiae TaxID=3075530 RepID=A0ABU2RVP2_9ACTN|nr:hypothetical protein [Streptomyces sp. DSM 41770]MDT0432908.1 hypothetical protein [Streptomyces sp. DSM 41770]
MNDYHPRVYGSGRDDLHPYAEPGRDYVALAGGPLDGLLLDVTGQSIEGRAGGAYLITDHGSYGPGGRADYEPRPENPDVWDWRGDVP